jgi:non-homologous end joining protein Ku/predicted HicB family RNase H-like nuclease
MSTVRYRDYQGGVEFEDGKLVLRILHIDDLITTEVDSASEVEAAFAELVEDYLASCAELDRAPDRPFKGLFNVRIPPLLHKQVAFAAANEALTLNAFVLSALEEKLGSQPVVGADAGHAHEPSMGFLRLALVTCPVKLHPAIDGPRDLAGDVMIEIEGFVPKSGVDGVYLSNPYYLVPGGLVGDDAYAVIREVIAATDTVAIASVRAGEVERMMILEPRGNAMLATVLRSTDEVRDPSDLVRSIRDIKVTKHMLDLAKHIVEAKSASFDPRKLEHMTKKRRKGPAEPKRASSRTGGNVIDLIDALRRSYRDEKSTGRDASSEPRRKA